MLGNKFYKKFKILGMIILMLLYVRKKEKDKLILHQRCEECCTHLCDQSIKRESDVTAYDLQSSSQNNPCQGEW